MAIWPAALGRSESRRDARVSRARRRWSGAAAADAATHGTSIAPWLRMISAETSSPSLAAADDDDGFEIRREPHAEAAEPHRRHRRKGKNKKHHQAVESLARAGVDPREKIMVVVQNAAAEIRKRPALAIAAAVGVGFVIGGALSMRLGRAALAAAGRWAMKRFTASF